MFLSSNLGAKYTINIVTPIDYQYNNVNKQMSISNWSYLSKAAKGIY